MAFCIESHHKRGIAVTIRILSLCLLIGLMTCGPAVAEPLRLATFNIRLPADKGVNAWSNRAPRVIALVKRHGFDLVGLQEATAMQFDEMLAALPGWASVGACREDGKRKGEASCILYRSDRFTVQKSGTFWLSETPEVPGSKSWQTACTRVCTWALMTDTKTGKPFALFNTHLDHLSAEARVNGMKLILERMRTLAPQGWPTFLTGDMNCDDASEPIRLAGKVLRDAVRHSQTPHKGPWRTFTAYQYRPDAEEPTAPAKDAPRIDYLFVSGNVTVRDVTTHNDAENGNYPSDHFPVSATVDF